jgi:SmpA / OmlA family
MRSMTLGGCIAIAAALAAAPAAEAKIQLDKGLAGVRIGDTRAQVKRTLGRPLKQRSGANEFGSYVQYVFRKGITVDFQGEDRVSSIVTTGRRERTSNGVGVGSSEAAVKTKVKGVRCETIGSARSCHTGRLVGGRKVTDFRVVDGKVASVFVGLVLD